MIFLGYPQATYCLGLKIFIILCDQNNKPNFFQYELENIHLYDHVKQINNLDFCNDIFANDFKILFNFLSNVEEMNL